MTAANDNKPRRADTFESMAARREWLSSLPVWDGRQVGASPTVTRLARADRKDDLLALRAWRAATEPQRIVAANDNDPEVDEHGDPIPPSIDSTMEIRPSVNELVEASKRPAEVPAEARITASRDRADAHRWTGGDVSYSSGALTFDSRARLSGWRDHAGRMWAVAASGNVSRRREYGRARGGASGAVSPELIVSDVRADQDAALHNIDAKRLRDRLGDRHAGVLDMALGTTTAEEIAIEVVGANPGKYAQRRGVRLVDEAIAAFRALADVPSIAVRAA